MQVKTKLMTSLTWKEKFILKKSIRLNSAAGGRTRQRLDVAGGRGDAAGAGGRGRAGGDATCAEARERTRTWTAGDMLLRLASVR